MHQNRKQFIYKEQGRLDKFIVLELCSKCILNSGIRSDHKGIKINFSSSKRGPGHWKLNATLLNDQLYLENIKELIKTLNESYTCLSKQMVLEISQGFHYVTGCVGLYESVH